MILIVCTDDPALVKIAHDSSQGHLQIFGNYYQIYSKQIPTLQANENLFIIAHGAYHGDEGDPVIGDKRNAFYVNAADLSLNLQSIFPKDYMGRIFVDACESADFDKDTVSFIEMLNAVLYDRYPAVEVYGRNGTAKGQIPLPGYPGWTRA